MSPYSLTVHYTTVSKEVVSADTQLYDVSSDAASFTASPKSLKASDLKVSQMVKISVSYDIAKIDELAALQFISKMRFYLNDPEMLLL